MEFATFHSLLLVSFGMEGAYIKHCIKFTYKQKMFYKMCYFIIKIEYLGEILNDFLDKLYFLCTNAFQ